MKLLRYAQFLKISPFDTNSESGRTKERYRLSAWGAVVNGFSSSLSVVLLFISVPLTLSYLSEERFGVWMTVASFANMLTFLDLGVGNALVSHIAKARAQNDIQVLQCSITRGLLLLCGIGVFIGLTLTILNVLMPLSTVISLETAQARVDAERCSWMFIFFFSFSVPVGGIYRILNGMQKSWLVHTARSLGFISSIIGITLLATIEADPHYLLAVTYGVQATFPLILLPYFVKKSWFTIGPHRNRSEAMSEYSGLLRIGGLFLFLQIGTMIGWGSDALLVSTLVGAGAVTQLAIAQRLFHFVSVPLAILNGPLWAAYADAKSNNDYRFVRKTLKVSVLGTLMVSALLSLAIFLLSDLLLKVWIGGSTEVSRSLLMAFLFWKVLESTGNSFSMFLNGFHIVRPQVIAVTLFCLTSLTLKIYFAPLLGAAAVVWSTVFAYIVCVVLFYLVLFNKTTLMRLLEKG